ncbi:hypothetical protein Bbelb_137780 [Branchiostoma belcheri]|nr:hypothetical protein Bbelb_137780 [Branchiostoma belcheri]
MDRQRSRREIFIVQLCYHDILECWKRDWYTFLNSPRSSGYKHSFQNQKTVSGEPRLCLITSHSRFLSSDALRPAPRPYQSITRTRDEKRKGKCPLGTLPDILIFLTTLHSPPTSGTTK